MGQDWRIGDLLFTTTRSPLITGTNEYKTGGHARRGTVKLHNRSFLSRQLGSKPMSQTGYTSAD